MTITENALKVLQKRYLLKDGAGNPIEGPEDLFKRVANAVAQAEYNYIHTNDGIPNRIVNIIEKDFYGMMMNLDFLPNSPTLMNAGRALGQLSACFVLPISNDIRQVLRTIKNTALIHKSGGGTGFGFSKVKMSSQLPEEYKPVFVLDSAHTDAQLLREKIFSHAETLVASKTVINSLCESNKDETLIIEDTMESIFDLEKLLDMPKFIVFSNIRPHKSKVSTTGGEASGPVSFMQVWNEAVKFLTSSITPITAIKLSNMCTEVVKQGGTRRGANMGIVNIDSEYIKEFITCKQDTSEITNFNLSVGIVEGFWEIYEYAIEHPEKNVRFPLKDYSTNMVVGSINPIEIMDMIISNAWHNGEPGIIFLDVINKANPVDEEIESTNPCGEQPLLGFEACNLGSINLLKMVKKDENGKWVIDFDKLERTVNKSVRFLDDVIDVNKYPLPEIDEKTKKYRKIGLGVMGWADLLYLLEIPYNSEEAVKLARTLSKFIQEKSHTASLEIGRVRGAFPAVEESIYKGTTMRNATTSTIAPTGTLSIIASVSSGIEPQFAISYVRNAMDNDELDYVNPLFKEAFIKETGFEENSPEYKKVMIEVAKNGTVHGLEGVPKKLQNIFVTAHDIDVEWHIKHQAAWQQNVDNAVSKTINMTHNATKDDVRKAYILSRQMGCKGITIYRDGSRENQVLNIGKKTDENKVDNITIEEKPSYPIPTPRPRPDITTGFTEKVKIGCGNLYVTVNYDEHGICEVFTNTGKAGGCPSQSEATARLVSLALRAGVDVKAIIDQLKGIRCPSTIRQKGLKVTSCPDAIGRLIEKVYLGQITPAKMQIPELDAVDDEIVTETIDCNHQCSQCGMKDFCNNPDEGEMECKHPDLKTCGDCSEITTCGLTQMDNQPVELGVDEGEMECKHPDLKTCGDCSEITTCGLTQMDNQPVELGVDEGKQTRFCPECGRKVEHAGGCVQCICGWSKCG